MQVEETKDEEGAKQFVRQKREKNEDVQLDFDLLKKDDGVKRKPLIVIHGLFANKTSLKALINQDSILEKRDCYLID